MGLVTPNRGYPYPLRTDLNAGPADLAALALANDAEYPTWDAGFVGVTKSHSFLARTTTALSAIASNTNQQLAFQTIDFSNAGAYDNTLMQFSQPAGEGPSWWVLGVYLNVNIPTGTPTALTYMGAAISWVDFDPVASQDLSGTIQGETVETTTGGFSSINLSGIVMFRGTTGATFATVSWGHNDAGALVTKQVTTGSYFYGFRLGSA